MSPRRLLISAQPSSERGHGWNLVQGDAEVIPVRSQDLAVRAQLLLGAGPAAGPDQGAATERDPAVLGEPGADRAEGEVGVRRGLLPPAGRHKIVQVTFPLLDPVLRLAVLDQLHVAVRGVDEREPAARIGLVFPVAVTERVGAVAAKADVGQPWAAAAGQPYHQGQVVEQRPELPLPAVDTGRDPRYLGAQRFEQEREGPVELVAEAAPPPGYDLGEQVALVQGDRLGQVDAQVLERDG